MEIIEISELLELLVLRIMFHCKYFGSLFEKLIFCSVIE